MSSPIPHPLNRRTAALAACLGASLGLAPGAHADPWNPDITGKLPWSTATADFNKDGKLDSVFGYPEGYGGHGIVGVWFNDGDPRKGAVENASNSPGNYITKLAEHYMLIRPSSPLLQGSEVFNKTFTKFGASVVTGDFDGDGRPDLAFGVPGATIAGQARAGAVVVIYGKDLGDPLANPPIPPTAGAAVTFTQNSPGVGSSAEADDYFGEVLAVGDLDCNGVDDLVIGVPREDVGVNAPDAGYVHVLYGKVGSGLSGVGSSTLWQGGGPLSDTYEAHDHFGASLATGVFIPSNFLGQRWCDSLAIGVPGEDFVHGGANRVDAGRVHLLLAPTYPSGGYFGGFQPITQGTELVLDQSLANVYSSPESREGFGAQLGRVKGSIAMLGNARSHIDDLWISAPGENCNNCPDGIMHRVGYYTGWSWHRSSVRLDILEEETGVVLEKGDAFGRWLQYIPQGVDPSTAEVFVVVHGTNRYTSNEGDSWPGGRANANRFMAYEGFIAAADARKMILIMPQFEDWNFGNAMNIPVNAGGYRALVGRDINADVWVGRIVDRYKYAGLGNGRFHLFGHSAGAQFAVRYALQWPQRMRGVIVESSGSMPQPTTNSNPQTWRNGFGPLFSMGADAWFIFYVPNEAIAGWAARNVPMQIVAGSLEADTHTVAVQQWMADVAQAWGQHQMSYCEVQGVGHDSKNAHASALRTLWPELSFPTAPACL